MKKPNIFVQIAVVWSSVALVGGCIALRSGLLASVNPFTPSIENSEPILEEVDGDPLSLEVMSTSKSISPAVMYGSKSMPRVLEPKKADGASGP